MIGYSARRDVRLERHNQDGVPDAETQSNFELIDTKSGPIVHKWPFVALLPDSLVNRTQMT